MSAARTSPATEWKFLVLAVLCVWGTWSYVDRVLIPYQIAQAAADGRGRGILSDLLPRWFGARELLLHGRDPYGPEVTREVQQEYYGHTLDPNRQEYYGHPLDPHRRSEPTDQERFAYPLYVSFLLAPTLHQPFATVRIEVFWISFALTVAATLTWLSLLHWDLPAIGQAAIIIFTVGNLAVLQGLKLQQLSLVVAALLALAVWLLTKDRQVAAGAVLALATIKPQLVAILLLWLFLWTLAAWRRRWRWLASFLVSLTILVLVSEIYLPHWLPRFLEAVREYRMYTDAVPIVAKLIPWPANLVPWLVLGGATAYAGWRHRTHDAAAPEFAGTVAMLLASTVVVIPNYSLYNQVLLLPAVLFLARDRGALWQSGILSRALLLLSGIFLAWPWLSGTVLAALSFVFPAEMVERGWALPFWTSLLLPVGVAALVLVAHFRPPFAAPEMPVTS